MITVNKYFTLTENAPKRHRWAGENKKVMMSVIMISAFLSVCSSFFLEMKQLFIVAPMGIVAFFYAYPLFPWKMNLKRIRDIPGIKLFIIAFVFAIITYVLPIISFVEFTYYTGIGLLARFFFVAAITIPFDVRDINFDDKKIKTIPIVFGENKSIYFSLSFLLVSTIFNFFLYSYKILLVNSLMVEIAILAVAFIAIVFSRHKSEYYYVIVLEGLMILHPLLVFLFS